MSSENSGSPSDKRTEQLPVSKNLERYDLTGNRIRQWTMRAREMLVNSFRRVLAFGVSVGSRQLPGSDSTIGDKVKTAPGMGLNFLESQIEKTPIENQLKSAQTETEYLKQELLRQQIEQTAAQTRGQQLDNVAKELEIQQRILEITDGKTGIRFIDSSDRKGIVFGNLPPTAEGEVEEAI